MIDKDYSFKLDIKNKSAIPKMEFVRGDLNTSVLNITLTENGVPIDLTGYTLMAVFKKPDNTRVIEDVTIINATKGLVRVVLSTQTITAIGEVLGTITLTSATGDKVTFSLFKFKVRENLDNDELIESTNEFPILSKLIAENQQIKNEEAKRITAENIRTSNENSRISNETERQDNEAKRISAESNRAAAETSRVSAENSRISNETERQNNETIRQNNESKRQNTLATMQDRLKQFNNLDVVKTEDKVNDLLDKQKIMIKDSNGITVTRNSVVTNPLENYNYTSSNTIPADTVITINNMDTKEVNLLSDLQITNLDLFKAIPLNKVCYKVNSEGLLSLAIL